MDSFSVNLLLINFSNFCSIISSCFSILDRRLSAFFVHLTVVSFFLVSGFCGLLDIRIDFFGNSDRNKIIIEFINVQVLI